MAPSTSTVEDNYFDLGQFGRPVTTNNEHAQTWFNRGLIWAYSFHHEESIRCFEKAIAADPDCAMAYWGLALSLGPNYNKPWELFDPQDLKDSVKRAYEASQKAKALATNASKVEIALINALQFRYAKEHPSDDLAATNLNYATSMRGVYEEFGDDPDVTALYVESMMDLTPWRLWDIHTGNPATNSRAPQVQDILERALAKPEAQRHPGLLHMYIHLMEMSPEPEKALKPANQLLGIVPDAAHLQHMPSHIDIVCGDYRQAINSNLEAVRADNKFLEQGTFSTFYMLYVAHDYHTLIYAAMFAGQYKVAMEATDKVEAVLPPELLRVESPPMADWLEAFYATRAHVLVRFGRWQETIDLPLPDDEKLFCSTIASLHYAKGVAHAALGQVEEADKQRTLFLEAKKRVPESRMEYPNKVHDVLNIAEKVLDGELEYRRGNIDVAFEHLKKAMALDDSLVFSEPWAWMMPTRHSLAALMLEQGRVEEAADLYRADLGFDETMPRARQHPNNVWALHGYHECLIRLGRTEEARVVGKSLKKAKAMADVTIESSCYCRRGNA